MGEAVVASLESFFFKNWFRGLIQLYSARVSDSGDVEILAHTEHRGDLERLIQTTAWHEGFERSLGPLPSQTYNVRMHNMRIGCMELRNRKEKAAVVMTLVDNNFPVELDNGSGTIIGDIFSCSKDFVRKEKNATAVMIDFLFPEYANKAIGKGLNWQGIATLVISRISIYLVFGDAGIVNTTVTSCRHAPLRLDAKNALGNIKRRIVHLPT